MEFGPRSEQYLLVNLKRTFHTFAQGSTFSFPVGQAVGQAVYQQKQPLAAGDERLNYLLWTALSAQHCNHLHCSELNCTGLHCTLLHSTGLHCTLLHTTVLQCTALYCTQEHCPTLHCPALHSINIQNAALSCSTRVAHIAPQ